MNTIYNSFLRQMRFEYENLQWIIIFGDLSLNFDNEFPKQKHIFAH